MLPPIPNFLRFYVAIRQKMTFSKAQFESHVIALPPWMAQAAM